MKYRRKPDAGPRNYAEHAEAVRRKRKDPDPMDAGPQARGAKSLGDASTDRAKPD
jgi:hypothetical protein